MSTANTPNPSSPNPTTTTRQPVVVAAIALIIALLATACNPLTSGEARSEVQPTETESVDAGAELYTASSTRAVVQHDQVVVYDAPGGETIQTLTGTTGYGTTRVMLVEALTDGWVKVRLPTRPNHRTGWVRADSVSLEQVEPVVHIDLATRTLTVISGNQVLAEATVAVGSAENPTPVGTFYITDKLETPDSSGAYGPFAFGLSGYSETLSEFAGGNGQIGMHGTNDPASLGQPVSHGCVRLPNELVEMLAETLPLGTPVHIV